MEQASSDAGPSDRVRLHFFSACGGRGKEIKVFDSVRTVSCTIHLAVPGECCGLTLILAFSDRCGNCELASSATDSASPQFPRQRQGLCHPERSITTRGKRATIPGLPERVEGSSPVRRKSPGPHRRGGYQPPDRPAPHARAADSRPYGETGPPFRVQSVLCKLSAAHPL